MKRRKKSGLNIAITCFFVLFVSILLFLINKIDIPNIQNARSDSSNIINFPETNFEKFPMSVHFLNVGHADAALIQCEGKNILIDSGWQDLNSHVILYCKERNVEKFDLVIATHPHGDHIGEMPKIIENFPIDMFIISEFQEGYQEKVHSSYTKMLKSLDMNKQIKVKKVRAGENFRLGNLKINILSPSKKHNAINNNSIVLNLKFGERSFLFTGDAEKEAEKIMLEKFSNLKFDVLKVAHHGSSTSSQEKFISAVSPEYSIISFGETTYAVNPNKKTLKTLEKVNSKILRTDKFGDIVIYTDGKKLVLGTENTENIAQAA